PQVRHQRFMAERAPRHAPAQLRGRVPVADAVDFVMEPSLEALELALTEITFWLTQVVAGLFHELSGVEVAQRVGREVTEAAHAPVNVLQAALDIRLRAELERLLELFVPHARYVGCL